MNKKIRTLLEYYGFISKAMDKAMDLLEWAARDTHEFELVSCTLGMSFSNPSVFHVRSFSKEIVVTRCSRPSFMFQRASPTYDG